MSESVSSTAPAAALPFVYPLDDYYAHHGLKLPAFERLAGEQVPEPYHSLLVHMRDMTPTLEGYHQNTIHLEIINREQRGDFYFREVVLRLDGSEQRVEFGANKVSLTLFPPRARHLILEERRPLGRILRECDIVHHTVAKAFFKVLADPLMCRVLALTQPVILYGRRATIMDAQRRPLSEVVEILPPLPNGK